VRRALQHWHHIRKATAAADTETTTTTTIVSKLYDDAPHLAKVLESIELWPAEDPVVVVDGGSGGATVVSTPYSSSCRSSSSSKTYGSAVGLGQCLIDANRLVWCWLKSMMLADQMLPNHCGRRTMATTARKKQQQWKIATRGAVSGEVFVQIVVSKGQADLLGVVAVGGRLQGVGELPMVRGGFERDVQMALHVLVCWLLCFDF
jgi:hypothetical protein